jgi:hypothetical protein
MPIYVLGDFGVESQEERFRLSRPNRLELGPWTEQGMPFYSEKVVYRYRFSLDTSTEEVQIALPKWSGSAARILVDGEDCGVIAWPPDLLRIRREIRAGEHELSIVVAGNMKNLLGPHFSDGLPGIWSWRWSGQKTQPPKKYKLTHCGLMESPLMVVAR